MGIDLHVQYLNAGFLFVDFMLVQMVLQGLDLFGHIVQGLINVVGFFNSRFRQ